MMKFFLQRGAMFGLDARITLVIAALVALVVGLQQTQKIDRLKITETEQRLARIKAASLHYYQDGGFFPTDVAGDLTTFDNNGQPYLSISDTVDAWGATFTLVDVAPCGYHVETNDSSKNIYVFSAGPNGVFDYDYAAESGKACDEHATTVEAYLTGDDLMIKVSSYEIDSHFYKQAKKQLEEIAAKITALAEHNRIRWQRTCEATGVATTGCDYDANGAYVKGEEQSMNFFPYATEVVTGCAASRPFYADNASFSRSYTSNNAVSMQALMTVLGLPTSYASLKGNVLRYDSNDGNRCSGPFNFKIYYY